MYLPLTPVLTKTREARKAQRKRMEARVSRSHEQRPTLSLDRMSPLLEVLRVYREDRDQGTLSSYLENLKKEVTDLESWVEGRTRRQQKEGATIRQALEFLRIFGRMTVLDFSNIPMEERDLLVTLLALEHRWCYAAAGTTRSVFKVAIGRTGAR